GPRCTGPPGQAVRTRRQGDRDGPRSCGKGPEPRGGEGQSGRSGDRVDPPRRGEGIPEPGSPPPVLPRSRRPPGRCGPVEETPWRGGLGGRSFRQDRPRLSPAKRPGRGEEDRRM